MDQLNLSFMICLIFRFIMLVCLTVLIVNLYINIDMFSPDSKKVNIEELIQKYDEGDGHSSV